MIEYRTERVDPQNESTVIDILQTFGWVLASSQEIYNESTEVVGVDVKVYGDDFFGGFMQGWTGSDGKVNVRQRKNITNYVVLKFERDTDMPNYSELSELNSEFDSKLNVVEPKKPIKRTVITAVGTIIILISIIMALIQGTSALLWEILVCVIFPIVMIPITALGWVKYKRNSEYYNSVLYRLNEIYSEAQSLVSLKKGSLNNQASFFYFKYFFKSSTLVSLSQGKPSLPKCP